MILSKTAQYAVRALSYMAYNNRPKYSATELVQELNISDKYLKRVLTTLSANGIITSCKGRGGGYSLAMKEQEIKLLDIVSSVEDVEKYYGCFLGFKSCSDDDPCSFHNKWAPIREELLDFMQNTSLLDVLRNPQVLRF